MKANTALALICGGLLLTTSEPRSVVRRGVRLCGAGVLIILGGLTLAEYAWDANLGIDELLFRDTPGAVRTVHPGRLAPQTAASFVLLGVAAGLLAFRPRAARAVELLAGTVIIGAAFAVIGYLYGAEPLHGLPGATPIAPHTAVALLLLGAGVIAAARTGPIADALAGQRSGGVMTRRLLPAAVILLPLLGWLRLHGEKQGLYGTDDGTALLVVATLLVTAIGILSTSRVLNRLDEARAKARGAEQRLAAIISATDAAIVSADLEGRITSFNAGSERLFGYAADEVLGRPFVEILKPPADDDEQLQRFAAVISGQAAGAYEVQRLGRDGQVLDLAMTVAPVSDGHAIVGVSAIYHDISERTRAQQRLEYLVAERTAALQASKNETLRRLAKAAEYRDDDTHQHTERVGHLAALLAEKVGLPAHEIELIRQAAPLHDVGKIAIPDAILLKPGRLTDDEFDTMRAHTVIGSQLLAESESEILRMAERIALYHHERWDGAGYPFGLARTDIPLVGRIVAIADVFDALTHDRPYKTAWTIEDAVTEIRRVSGTQFDPNIVAAFDALHAEGALSSLDGHEQTRWSRTVAPPTRHDRSNAASRRRE